MNNTPKFRVIIVGAGPVGLYMAHALSRANIDYVVLEQQSTILNFSGQLLFTWPQTVRLFDQIGLYEPIKEASMTLHQKKRVWGKDGHVMTTSRFWDCMQYNHGYSFLPILRSELIKILYTNLKDKETKVKTSAEVVDIKNHAEGVQVHLKDGSIENGTIVIGADGVHSKTRAIMQISAKESLAADNNPMVSTFYGIFGRAPNDDLRIDPEILFESRGAGTVIQCVGSKEILQFVTLKPLPDPTTDRTKYTREDMEEYAASLADVAVCPGVKFKDVWAKADKSTARLLNQEEGFLNHWHHGRIVLVGDGVSKSTSVNGLGMTCGLHSAALLANELQSLVASHSNPSSDLLEQVFARYQKERQGEVKTIWDNGYSMIREVTQRSWASWFWDSYILPWVDMENFAWGYLVSLLLIRHGQTLSYVPFDGKHGKVPWVRRAPPL